MSRSFILRLALYNLRGSKSRSAILVAAILTLTVLLFVSDVVGAGVEHSVRSGLEGVGADLLVTSEREDPLMQMLALSLGPQEVILITPPKRFHLELQSTLSELSRIEGVDKIAPQLYVGEYTNKRGYSYQVIAIDEDRDFTVKRWFDGDLREVLSRGFAVIGPRVMVDGDAINFYGNQLMIYGRLRESGTGLDGSIVVSLDQAYRMNLSGSRRHYSVGDASAFLIAINHEYTAEEVAARVDSSLEGVSVVTATRVVSAVKEAVSGIVLYLSLINTSIWVMSVVLISAVLSMAINERRKQIGVLRALGMKRGQVLMMVVSEALIIALIGGVIGVALGAVGIQLMSGSISALLGLQNIMPDQYAVAAITIQSISISILTAVIAAIYPAVIASRLDPYVAIRTGE